MYRSRIIRAAAAAATVGALALAGTAVPASAAPINDVLISGPTFDTHFGTNFSAGEAQDPGTLDWNDVGGNQKPVLNGYLYAQQAAGVTAKVEMKIYDDALHSTLIATKQRTLSGATGLGTLAISNLGNVTCKCTHVHVRVLDDRTGTMQVVPGGDQFYNL
jgi:hypothetical protein